MKKPHKIGTIEDVWGLYDTQTEIANLYEPPVSQQAVSLWMRNREVPSDRIPELHADVVARGYELELSVLNPRFDVKPKKKKARAA